MLNFCSERCVWQTVIEWLIVLGIFIISFFITYKGKERGEYAKEVREEIINIRESIINTCISIGEFLKICLRLAIRALGIFAIYTGFEYVNSEYPSHAWSFFGGFIAACIFANYIVEEIWSKIDSYLGYKIDFMRDDIRQLQRDIDQIKCNI